MKTNYPVALAGLMTCLSFVPAVHGMPQTVAQFAQPTITTKATSASVLVVGPVLGPGVDFTQISDAIAAASDGDIIRIQPSPHQDYLPFAIDGKGVSLFATDPTQRSGISTPSITNLRAGQLARMVGFPKDQLSGVLLLENNAGAVQLSALHLSSLRLVNSSGGTWLLDSEVGYETGQPAGQHAIEVDRGRRLTLQRCLIRTGMDSNTLNAIGGTIYAYDSRFEAPPTQPTGAAGSSGVVLDRGAFLYTEDCSIQGGDAINTDGNCGLPGGSAILLTGRATGGFRNTKLDGGLGRDTCLSEPSQAQRIEVQGGGQYFLGKRTAQRLTGPSQVEVGQPVTYRFEGQPRSIVKFFYSPRTVNNYVQLTQSVLYLPSSMTELATVVLDQSGKGSYTLRNAMPEGSPAVDIYTQAAFLINVNGVPDGPLTFLGVSNPIRTTFLNSDG